MRLFSVIAVVLVSGLTTGAQAPQTTCEKARRLYQNAVFDQVRNAAFIQRMLELSKPWTPTWEATVGHLRDAARTMDADLATMDAQAAQIRKVCR
jgi:hypothetical protein